MRMRILAPALGLVVMLVAGTAAAVDVVNGDTRPHAVQVEEWGETVVFTIAPGATLTNVCVACRVRLSDGASPTVSAEDNDIVVIRDGVPRNGG